MKKDRMFEAPKKKAPKPKSLEQLETVVLGEERTIADRAKIDERRKELATDSEFWFSVVFPDRASKDKFLHAVGVTHPPMNDKYINGMLLAEFLGIEIDKVVLPAISGKIDRKYVEISMPLPKGGE